MTNMLKKLFKWGTFNDYLATILPFFDHHLPPRRHFQLWTWTKIGIFWTTFDLFLSTYSIHWTSPWSEVYLSEMTCYKIHTLISQKSSNRQGKKRQKEKPRHLWENSRQNLKTCHLNHLMIQLLRLSLPNLSARKNLPKIIMLQPSLGKFRNGSI